MIKVLYPDFFYTNIYDIDFDLLLSRGIKGIIFDIDNTLVRDGVKKPDERLRGFIRGLEDKGFSMSLLSNNSQERVDVFNSEFGFPSVSRAGKPSRKGYLSLCAKMGVSPDECVMVGDQIYTDICGANRAGLTSVLVVPHNPNETWFCAFKRIFEKGILKKLKVGEQDV